MAHGEVADCERTRAVTDRSPRAVRQMERNWLAVPQMSSPPPVTLQIPPATLWLPGRAGEPMSAQCQPGGQTPDGVGASVALAVAVGVPLAIAVGVPLAVDVSVPVAVELGTRLLVGVAVAVGLAVAVRAMV